MPYFSSKKKDFAIQNSRQIYHFDSSLNYSSIIKEQNCLVGLNKIYSFTLKAEELSGPEPLGRYGLPEPLAPYKK